MVLGHAPDDGSVLLDESAPGLAASIAKHQAEAVGNAGDGAAVGVAKRVADRFVGHFFGCSAPDVAEFVAQAQVIAMAEAVQARSSTLFLEIEEAARHFAVRAPTFEDTILYHQSHYQDLCSSFRLGNRLNVADLRTYILLVR